VLAVLGSPSLEDFVVVASKAHGELDEIDAVAGLDLFDQRGVHLDVDSCAVELRGNDAAEVEIFRGWRRFSQEITQSPMRKPYPALMSIACPVIASAPGVQR
jgi:hypothetical protein